MPILTDIAQAVTDALGTLAYGEPVIIERSYLPRFELADMSQLRITVVPAAIEVASASRAQAVERYRIDIGVQKKLTADDLQAIDTLIQITQQIADLFRFRRLPSLASAVWVKTEHEPLYDPQHMEELRQFTAVIRLTFQVVR